MQAAGALMLVACSGLPRALPEDPRSELTAVPFFPQSEYQCGPAALATVLNFSGAATTPDELVPQVYIPAKRGSLQVEMLAAARRAGRIPYAVDPESTALEAELAAGNPVLVLQDLVPPGLAWSGVRRWHYAVVVGYDAGRELYVLRSGRERRRLEPAERFLRSWAASGRWGIVIGAPGVVPASAVPERYLRAVVDAQGALPADAVDTAYAAMLERWPEEPVVLFAAANRAYAEKWTADAEALYRRLLALEPAHVAGRNNLANLLLDLGCPADALREAEIAHTAATDAPAFRDAVQNTLRKAAAAASGASGVCTNGLDRDPPPPEGNPG